MQFKDEWQGQQTECPYCSIMIVLPSGQSTFSSKVNSNVHNSRQQRDGNSVQLEDLTLRDVIPVYAIIVLPWINLIGLLFADVLYHKWRKTYPIKANNLQLHTWIAFFIGYVPYNWYIINLLMNSK